MVLNHKLPNKAFAATLAAIGSLAGPGLSGAMAATVNVVYTASGKFASPQISGSDGLKLAGEPFKISIVASPSSVPNKAGSNWDYFLPLPMTGVVYSALFDRTPVDISSVHASIYLAMGDTRDAFTATFPLKILGVYITVDAQISLPAGTLTNPLIHPFAAVELSPDNATVTYTDTSDATVLAIAAGSLVAELSDTANLTHTARAGHHDEADAGDQASALVPRVRRFELRNP
jgi:hypothetical protein